MGDHPHDGGKPIPANDVIELVFQTLNDNNVRLEEIQRVCVTQSENSYVVLVKKGGLFSGEIVPSSLGFTVYEAPLPRGWSISPHPIHSSLEVYSDGKTKPLFHRPGVSCEKVAHALKLFIAANVAVVNADDKILQTHLHPGASVTTDVLSEFQVTLKKWSDPRLALTGLTLEQLAAGL